MGDEAVAGGVTTTASDVSGGVPWPVGGLV
jgi:hypothetical protein